MTYECRSVLAGGRYKRVWQDAFNCISCQTLFLSFAKGNPMRYPKKEINTPAATAEPITPEMLLAMQY